VGGAVDVYVYYFLGLGVRQVASMAQLGANLKLKKQADNTFLREDIPKNVKRVIIKVGTSVLTRDQEFGVSLTRLASLVEQVSALVHMGKEVIIVTSGAVGFGKMKLQVGSLIIVMLYCIHASIL